jgi:hypothetical protein
MWIRCRCYKHMHDAKGLSQFGDSPFLCPLQRHAGGYCVRASALMTLSRFITSFSPRPK